MSVLNKTKLDEVSRQFKAMFLNSLGQAARWSEALGMEQISIKGSELKPKFMARESGVQEWLDERVKSRLRVLDFAIGVKRWANGLRVHEDDLEDDQSNLDLYMPEIRDMADDFAEHRHQLFIDLIANGFTATKGLAYDGQFFFDTDHQDYTGGAVQSNKATAALSATAFKDARRDMMKIKKPNGLLANIRPTHLVIPVALLGTAEDIFVRQYDTSGATNPLYGAIPRDNIIADPRLDAVSATAWFLFDFSKAVKPVVFVNRRPVRWRAKTNPEGEMMFDNGFAEWGGDARYNEGFWFWQTSYGSTG